MAAFSMPTLASTPPCQRWVDRIETGHADHERRELAERTQRRRFQVCPKIPQAAEAIRYLVPGNNGAIDGADRCADDPVRLDAGVVQRLIGPGLVASGRSATLHDQHDLTGKLRAA
jgi:hypothetical protein